MTCDPARSVAAKAAHIAVLLPAGALVNEG
jgi:hypothetical protein